MKKQQQKKSYKEGSLAETRRAIDRAVKRLEGDSSDFRMRRITFGRNKQHKK